MNLKHILYFYAHYAKTNNVISDMLASDGSCKAFDATGSGYVRSEAIVAIYLQKAHNARRVYATLVHSATNSDGYKDLGLYLSKATFIN